MGPQLGVAVNYEPQHGWAIALGPGAQQAELGRPPFLPWEEWQRSTPQESAGFGDWKWGHVPGMEILGWRPGEYRVQTQTRETEVTDCFSLRAHLAFGSGARDWEAAIFILIL